MRIAVALLVLAMAAPAAADHKAAERMFRLGEHAYRAQNFLAAAKNFEQAYKELPAPEIAFSAAQAYRRQYRVDKAHTEYVELALKYYNLYVKEVKTGGRVRDAADSIEEMERELARIGTHGKAVAAQESQTQLAVSITFADKQQATGMREIEDKDMAPQIAVKTSVDGKDVTPDELHPIEPGDHVVRGEAAGYAPLEKRIRVVAGAPLPVELELQPLPAQIHVETEPGATVIVDGKGVGEAPLAAIPVAGGAHVITIVHSGRRAAARELTVTRAQALTVTVPLESTLRRRSVPWVIGVAGGFVVAGGVAALGAWRWDQTAVDRQTILDNQGDQKPEVLDAYNDARNKRDYAITGIWIAGGAAAAVGLTAAWLYYFDSPSAEGVRVVPVASGQAAGAVISGRF